MIKKTKNGIKAVSSIPDIKDRTNQVFEQKKEELRVLKAKKNLSPEERARKQELAVQIKRLHDALYVYL